MPQPPTIPQVLETCLYVTDLPAAEQFYVQVLGLTVISRQQGRHIFLRCGDAMLLLFDPVASGQAGDTPPHGATGPGHVAFAMQASDVDRWRNHLAASGVTIEQEIAWPQGGHSLYFRDPSDNSVELATGSIWGL